MAASSMQGGATAIKGMSIRFACDSAKRMRSCNALVSTVSESSLWMVVRI